MVSLLAWLGTVAVVAVVAAVVVARSRSQSLLPSRTSLTALDTPAVSHRANMSNPFAVLGGGDDEEATDSGSGDESEWKGQAAAEHEASPNVGGPSPSVRLEQQSSLLLVQF